MAEAMRKVTDWRGPFFFLQMADPQLGFFPDPLRPSLSPDASFEEDIALLEKAIAQANRLDPAFVVICGDLIHETDFHQPEYEIQVKEFFRIVGKLNQKIPLFLLPGNHDVGKPSVENLRQYREVFGEDRYSFLCGGCRFIVINSPIICEPGMVDGEVWNQRKWLEVALERSKQEKSIHTIIFQHNPWFLTSAKEEDHYFNIPYHRRQHYLELFKEYNVRAVFSGHFHRNSYGTHGKLEMVTTGPVGKPLGEDPPGFRIVKVYQDRIEHTYYELDAVPNTVALTFGDRREIFDDR